MKIKQLSFAILFILSLVTGHYVAKIYSKPQTSSGRETIQLNPQENHLAKDYPPIKSVTRVLGSTDEKRQSIQEEKFADQIISVESWSTYSNELGLYTLDYPSDWTQPDCKYECHETKEKLIKTFFTDFNKDNEKYGQNAFVITISFTEGKVLNSKHNNFYIPTLGEENQEPQQEEGEEKNNAFLSGNEYEILINFYHRGLTFTLTASPYHPDKINLDQFPLIKKSLTNILKHMAKSINFRSKNSCNSSGYQPLDGDVESFSLIYPYLDYKNNITHLKIDYTLTSDHFKAKQDFIKKIDLINHGQEEDLIKIRNINCAANVQSLNYCQHSTYNFGFDEDNPYLLPIFESKNTQSIDIRNDNNSLDKFLSQKQQVYYYQKDEQWVTFKASNYQTLNIKCPKN